MLASPASPRRRAAAVAAALAVLGGGAAGCGPQGVSQCPDASTNPISDWGSPEDGDRPSMAWRLRATDVEAPSGGGSAVVGDLVLGVYDGCDVIAVDARTGMPRWTTGTEIGSSTGGSTFVDDDGSIVFMGSVRLDPDTGEVVETLGDDEIRMSGPVGVRSDGEEVVIVDLVADETRTFDAPWRDALESDTLPRRRHARTNDEIVDGTMYRYLEETGLLYAVDVDTGELRWARESAAAGFRFIGTVAGSAGGSALLACAALADPPDGVGALVRFDPLEGDVVSVAPMVPPDGSFETDSCSRPPSTGPGLAVFVFDGGVWAFDDATGAVRWYLPVDDGRTALVLEDRVYVQTARSLLTVDPVTGTVLHVEEEIGGDTSVPPMLGPDGLLIVYTGGFTALHRSLLG